MRWGVGLACSSAGMVGRGWGKSGRGGRFGYEGEGGMGRLYTFLSHSHSQS